jgi:hypothetical protein
MYLTAMNQLFKSLKLLNVSLGLILSFPEMKLVDEGENDAGRRKP